MSFVSPLIEVSFIELLSSLKAFALYLPTLKYDMAFIEWFPWATGASNMYCIDEYVLMDCVCRWKADLRLNPAEPNVYICRPCLIWGLLTGYKVFFSHFLLHLLNCRYIFPKCYYFGCSISSRLSRMLNSFWNGEVFTYCFFYFLFLIVIGPIWYILIMK